MPTLATAQLCVGSPSLADVAANAGAGAGFFDGGKQYGAGAAFGSQLFVAADFGIIDFDDAATSQKAITGTVGYEIPTESAAHICVGGTSTSAFGLEYPGADITTFQVGPVVAVGLEAELSPAVTLVPFGTLVWLYRRNSIDTAAGSGTETDNLGAVRLGASFVFNDRFAISPLVEFPVGVDGGGDTVFAPG